MTQTFHEQVTEKFGVSAYLDNPSPSVFKERLFVQLSRFCAIRYCIVRHVGFLLGAGYPAGDATAQPETVDQVSKLLRRPVPDAEQLWCSLQVFEAMPESSEIPAAESEAEGALFDALTILFVDPPSAERCRIAIAKAFGERNLELLLAFLAFVRTAHYWSETHPALAYEQDLLQLMSEHPILTQLMLDTSEVEWAQSRKALGRALDDLRSTTGALRDSEGRFRALANATFDVLYRMNRDWSEMRLLAGRGALADISEPAKDWLDRYIPAQEQPRLRLAIEAAIQTTSVFELEHKVLLLDGSTGWVLSRAIPLLDDAGRVIEWYGAAIDLTARKNAEQSLQDADRRKDEFLATLAHELRNPLAPLRNGLEIARARAPADPIMAKAIEIMDRQVRLLVHLVDDLLDVGRITSGKIELRRSRVSVKAVLLASYESSRAQIESRQHTLTMDECSDEWVIDADFDRMLQVFSNLLSNSAKYMKEGGTIHIQVGRQNGSVQIGVRDTGIGIPSEDLHAIFGIFAQVPAHRGNASGGLGIGLSLVKQLVEMHGGAVNAMSAGPGRGSTFIVQLPLVQAPATRSNGHSVAPTIKCEKRRVLVVDDNPDVSTSLAMLLSAWGHEVESAGEGRAAIEAVVRFQPDINFLDLGMPGMDGIEAARRIRGMPTGSNLLIVALTGRGQDQDREQTSAAGFDHHFLKPVETSALQSLIANAKRVRH